MMPLSLATKITLLSPWLSILGKEIGSHRIAFSMSDKLPMRSSRRLVTGSRHGGKDLVVGSGRGSLDARVFVGTNPTTNR
jgi:hypothetical protein